MASPSQHSSTEVVSLQETMRPAAHIDHCRFCFTILDAALHKKPDPEPNFNCDFDAGIFITWQTKHDEGRTSLRGCIGCLSPIPFAAALPEYALTSALRDTRFDPIASHELHTLQCGVSLLCNYESGKGYLDWEINTHGILIHFATRSEPARNYSATYLPEIAGEQGWSKEEAIRTLVKKAGYAGTVTQQVLDAISLTTYESSKATLTYQDYLLLCEQDAVSVGA